MEGDTKGKGTDTLGINSCRDNQRLEIVVDLFS